MGRRQTPAILPPAEYASLVPSGEKAADETPSYNWRQRLIVSGLVVLTLVVLVILAYVFVPASALS